MCGLKPRHSPAWSSVQTPKLGGAYLGSLGRGKGNREFVLLCWSFFLNRELFWRLGVGYASYGQLPRFDSLHNDEKKRRLQRHLEEHLCLMHRACEKRCRDGYQGPIDLLYASINFNVMTL
jgi:hypothetical protein